jgi:SAM-dependent methyltransferase
MHEASFEMMRAFRNAYVAPIDRPLRVLDVGSGSRPGVLTYGQLFEVPDFEYVGLDIEAGYNVDVVPDDPFSWPTIETESFDLVISGQTFEHNPYFWITAAEIARVLVPGGLTAIIAPSAGKVHRYPYDCWRFYPDSWSATCTYVGLDLEESFIDAPSPDRPIGGARMWHDSLMVARKPSVVSADFYRRLDAIVATRTSSPSPAEPKAGPAAAAYVGAHTLEHPRWTRWRLALVHHAPRVLRPVRNRLHADNRRRTLARGAAALPWPSGPSGSTSRPSSAPGAAGAEVGPSGPG